MSIFLWLWDLFFPQKCVFCQKIVKGQAKICEDCSEVLPRTVDSGNENWKLSSGAQCFAPLWYRENVQEAVVRLKFGGARYSARCFGELMAQVLPKDEYYDLVSWVPLSKKRRRKRGYNQAELIGRVVAEELGLETCDLLVKMKDNDAQTSLDDDHQRVKNVQGAYTLLDISVENLHILLVDDVITTGSTISECKKMLIEAGATQVTCLGLARARH